MAIAKVRYGQQISGNKQQTTSKATSVKTKNGPRVISMDEHLRLQRCGHGELGIEFALPGGDWIGDERRFINALPLTAQLVAFRKIGGHLSNVRLMRREGEHRATEFYLDFSRDELFRSLESSTCMKRGGDVHIMRQILARDIINRVGFPVLNLAKVHWPFIRTEKEDVAVLDSVHDTDLPDLFNALGIADGCRCWLRMFLASEAESLVKQNWRHVVLNLRAMLKLLEHPEKANFTAWNSRVMAMSDEEVLKLWQHLVRVAERYSGAFGCC